MSDEERAERVRHFAQSVQRSAMKALSALRRDAVRVQVSRPESLPTYQGSAQAVPLTVEITIGAEEVRKATIYPVWAEIEAESMAQAHALRVIHLALIEYDCWLLAAHRRL